MGSLRRGVLGLHRILNSTAIAPRGSVSATSPIPSETTLVPRPRFNWICGFSSDSIHSPEIDLSNEESKRRLFNRLLYRSKQRGFLELDLVLGKWVEEHIHSMDHNGIKSLVHVLDLENPDLWKWLTGQEQPPEAVSINPVFCAVREKVMNNLNSHSAPETRAMPGKPWVRGWDDIKKGRDSPVSGNQ
ncbi:hypothetical protein VitviT2T_025569 [Vitis vinifera]|uniref:Succinate dehydrogenase assembly factor 2, mitochondrial n=2 Tax=Vitis vinifera TaxID=29760 RepID=A0ABY9DL93_VITVI|nr:succinate dehydrogenase assembly factor 2, mitochondrial [Vitis vinifera]WKA07791.1 hypothetical protein VitviT2T_025569 [Vitis vinifera]|eukprot:XP_010646726.1 PREDICTED: succinate dehydrogenase assembly factor 2, mitochondrial isoform X1 [Vitis vinifera]